MIKIINSTISKFEDQKYIPIFIHQSKTNYYTLHQGNMYNSDYLEKFKNLVDMASAFKVQLYGQAIVDIATEVKYTRGGCRILYQDKNGHLQQTTKEQWLTCALIFQNERKIYIRIIEELDNDYTKGNDKHPEDIVKAY